MLPLSIDRMQMTHEHMKEPRPSEQSEKELTDEEWAAALEKDMAEHYSKILENVQWVAVGKPGW